MNLKRCFLLGFIACFFSSFNLSLSQEALQQFYTHDNDVKELNDLLIYLEDYYNLTFSFNSKIIEGKALPNLTGVDNLETLFQRVFSNQGIQYELTELNKVLLFRPRKNEIRISGIIRDKLSKETIPGAIIYIQNTNEILQATEQGQFYVKLKNVDSLSIKVHSLAYTPKELSYMEDDLNVLLELDFNNAIQTIIISPENEIEIIQISDPKKYQFKKRDIENNLSLLGNSETLELIKKIPEVHVGSEAQNGFIVKGGGQDQNLILIDGMPVYEVSHIGGVSSVFLTPAIKDIEFYSSGFPAQYGGKLSSVLDVQINDGNTEEYKVDSSLGLSGITLHSEGPIIKDKTALSISGRFSWIGAVTKPIFENVLFYDDPKFQFYDIYAKAHHRFKPTNRISVTYYRGLDDITLGSRREEIVDNGVIVNEDDNLIKWGNEVISAQYVSEFSKNVFFNANLGRSSYNFNGRGLYFQTTSLNSELEEREVEIETSSSIQDIRASLNFDIYDLQIGKLQFGTGMNYKDFDPRLFEQLTLNGAIDGSTSQVERQLSALEYYFYMSDELKFGTKFSVTLGLHANIYSLRKTEPTNYINIDPRFSFVYHTSTDQLSLSASIMHQNVHLLVNPGPGLPSDLWIPNTENIGPSNAIESALNYKRRFSKSVSAKILGYYKTLNNIKEYQSTSDIYYALLSNEPIIDIEDKETNWEDRIIEGKGFSYGFGFQSEYKDAKNEWNFSYFFSRAFNKFEEIDEGLSFPSRYDRKHNVSMYYKRKLKRNWSILLNGVFGDGYRYTLPTEALPPNGGPVQWIAPERNNTALPAFHHIDLSVNKRHDYSFGELNFQIGIYNVYNQYNPFYAYVSDNGNGTYKLNQLSVFPIIPHISVNFKN